MIETNGAGLILSGSAAQYHRCGAVRIFINNSNTADLLIVYRLAGLLVEEFYREVVDLAECC